jgi:hypothetical protein
MGSNAQSVSEAPVKSSCGSWADMVGEWIRQGTEGFIATQKILLDLAAQQNALALTILRERLGLLSPAPVGAIVDMAGKGVKNFLEAQQVVLDIVIKQNEILSEGLKPAITGSAVEGLAEVVHQGFDNFVTAQKQFLEFFQAETEGAVKDFTDGKRFDTARLSDLAREGMRNFLQSQQRFLAIVEEQITKKEETAPVPDDQRKRVDLFDMAKQSIDAFVKAQERLLDLASDQIDVNVKMTRQLFSMDVQAQPTTKLPDLVKKSVDSFVAAQKALVDLASKPRKHAERQEEHEAEMAAGRAS